MAALKNWIEVDETADAVPSPRLVAAPVKTRVGDFFSWSPDCGSQTSTQVLDCDWEITSPGYDPCRSASLAPREEEKKKPCPPSQTGPINYKGGITYRSGALLYSHGRFSGVVVGNTNPAQIVEVSGHLDGMGFQVGVISGQVPVSFTADSVEDLGNSTQGGVFQFEAGFGAGPATVAGGNGMLGSFPDRQGGHNVTADYGFDFLEVDPVLAVLDLLERPKFGFGFGASFKGITVTDAEVIGEIGIKDEDCE